uniref:Integrin subunit alpha 5 n=1 Tax=Scleropages formosus TaxID=113540 RepID=A0A8C9S7A2_SCLFO
ILFSSAHAAFNLDLERPAVYSGPAGSYFGYSVDFYLANSSSVGILIGAPKANTSQINIIEGGSVYFCPWSQRESSCHVIQFDKEGDRTYHVNDTDLQVEFKSYQWFGATVRSHGSTILACAPRYYWRTEQDIPKSDATGTCYLSVHNFSKFVEYAPCRTETHGPAGQGYCQGGFSADFTKNGKVVIGGPGSYYWQGQLIAATKDEIVKAYYPSYFLLSVTGQMQTRQAQANYDDSYLGFMCVSWRDTGMDFGVNWKGNMLVRELKEGGEKFSLGLKWLDSDFYCDAFQMGSYFGYAVAVCDINNDGLDDLLVGAPMFMVRGSGGRLEEVGRVYIYLQRGPLVLEPSFPPLTGTQMFARFGSSIAPLGDLDQDGFNDVAIGSPFGGEAQQGLVLIYNGQAGGVKEVPSQVLAGQWASSSLPASFGYAIRGNKDLDMNGYPDLIVGAFGVDKAILYRARPVVNSSASLLVYPTMINPEERNCIATSGNETIFVSCVNLSFCLSANGKHLPDVLEFVVEVQLDSMKQRQKGAVRRALFIDTQQPMMKRRLQLANGARACHQTKIYLREEREFRDKLSSIHVALNYSLDPTAPQDSHGLLPVLNYHTAELIEQKAQILLDCGEDNICVPDLKLAVHGDRQEVYLGDENSLTLTFNARNEGEGGAYEAELYVVLPPEADYSGISRNNDSLSQLTCSYEMENQTRYLSCDLGNPMKSGTSLWAGLRFTVPRLRDVDRTVQFEFQIRSKNENNSRSEVVPFRLEVAVQADVILQGVSRPDKVIFPPANQGDSQRQLEEQDIGPPVQHVYELVNNGPSMVSSILLELQCPMRAHGYRLMYPMSVSTQGPLNCSTHGVVNPLQLKLRSSPTEQTPLLSASADHHVERREARRDQLSELGNLSCFSVECWTLRCHVGLLERGTTAILKVRSLIWASTFTERPYKQYVLECSARYDVQKMPYAILSKEMPKGFRTVVTPVVWNKPDNQYSVPLWIIILAILAGLLLLTLLIYVLYKLGFFKRSLPYGTAMEKAHLKPQAASEA